MNDPVTVFIVDDHSVVRMGLKAYFDTLPDIELLGDAGSGEEAVKMIEELAPDVVLMDLVMPGIDGVEATRQVRRISPRTQVIVLTSYHEDEHIFPAIRAGALSYLLKNIDPDDLTDAIRHAKAGEAVLHTHVAARVVQELHGPRDERPNPFTELSNREMEVLKLIANGLSNQDIANELVIGERTVKSHVSNILSKLHLADRTQAAIFAWREGIARKNDQASG